MTTEPTRSDDPDRVSSPTYRQRLCQEQRDGEKVTVALRLLRAARRDTALLARIFRPEAEAFGEGDADANLADALRLED